jgi:hypothetical protein
VVVLRDIVAPRCETKVAARMAVVGFNFIIIVLLFVGNRTTAMAKAKATDIRAVAIVFLSDMPNTNI